MHKLSTPIFIVCALVLFAVLTLNLGRAFGRDNASTTYRCTSKDAVSILQDGTLSKEIGKIALEPFDAMVIDVSNGRITYPSTGKREDWIVETTGENENDYVLIPSSSGRLGNFAHTVTHFIRLRAATGETPRFMAFVLSYIVTGTCAIVQ